MAKFGKEIVQQYDSYGPIQVFDNGNQRTLMFGANDEQGSVLKAAPHQIRYDYVRAMLLVLLFKQDPQHCLLLGLGSGALATTLLHHYPQVKVDAVEIRHAVIQLAYSHFYLPRTSRLTVHQKDAVTFVSDATRGHCDIVFSDLYLATGMDLQQATSRFFDHCQQHMKANGWLVLNFWQDHRRLDILPLLAARFSQVWTNNIGHDNWVILASNQVATLDKSGTKKQIAILNKRFGFSFSSVGRGLNQALV